MDTRFWCYVGILFNQEYSPHSALKATLYKSALRYRFTHRNGTMYTFALKEYVAVPAEVLRTMYM